MQSLNTAYTEGVRGVGSVPTRVLAVPPTTDDPTAQTRNLPAANAKGNAPGVADPSSMGVRSGESPRVPGLGAGPVPVRPQAVGSNVSWSSEDMQRMLLNRPDVKAQAQAIMSSRTLQEADKKIQIKELLKKLR